MICHNTYRSKVEHCMFPTLTFNRFSELCFATCFCPFPSNFNFRLLAYVLISRCIILNYSMSRSNKTLLTTTLSLTVDRRSYQPCHHEFPQIHPSIFLVDSLFSWKHHPTLLDLLPILSVRHQYKCPIVHSRVG